MRIGPHVCMYDGIMQRFSDLQLVKAVLKPFVPDCCNLCQLLLEGAQILNLSNLNTRSKAVTCIPLLFL